MCGYVCSCYRQKTEEDQETKRLAPIPKRRPTISKLKSEQLLSARKSKGQISSARKSSRQEEASITSKEQIQQELEMEKNKNK